MNLRVNGKIMSDGIDELAKKGAETRKQVYICVTKTMKLKDEVGMAGPKGTQTRFVHLLSLRLLF